MSVGSTLFVDYIDPLADDEETARTRNQSIDIRSIKHRLQMVDTVGLGEEIDSLENEFLMYSSIGGNMMKISSEKNTENSFDFQTRGGHSIRYDGSSMTTEQHKSYDFENLVPAYRDPEDEEADFELEKPINTFSMKKETENESIKLESHSSTKDYYDLLTNSFKMSETDEISSIELNNVGAEKDSNNISLISKDGEGSIGISNLAEKKSNGILMTTADDGMLQIENTFDSGKTNAIQMTKELIKISNAEDKVVIEITADSLKITTDKDVSIEAGGAADIAAGGDVTVKSDGNVAIEGSEVDINSGKLVIKG